MAAPFVGGVDQQFHLIAEPWEALGSQFVCFGIFLGQPPWGVDSVQYVVGNVEGEVQSCAVVLYITGDREVTWIGGRGEGVAPVEDPSETRRVIPFAGRDDAVEHRRAAGPCIQCPRFGSADLEQRACE